MRDYKRNFLSLPPLSTKNVNGAENFHATKPNLIHRLTLFETHQLGFIPVAWISLTNRCAAAVVDGGHASEPSVYLPADRCCTLYRYASVVQIVRRTGRGERFRRMFYKIQEDTCLPVFGVDFVGTPAAAYGSKVISKVSQPRASRPGGEASAERRSTATVVGIHACIYERVRVHTG